VVIGAIVGDTLKEVVDRTLEHLRRDHPQLVDQIMRDEIVGLIEVSE
jgi:hypothetical protein